MVEEALWSGIMMHEMSIAPHLTLWFTFLSYLLVSLSPVPRILPFFTKSPSSSLVLHSMAWRSVRGSNVQYWPAPTSPAERPHAVRNALVSYEHTKKHQHGLEWYDITVNICSALESFLVLWWFKGCFRVLHSGKMSASKLKPHK